MNSGALQLIVPWWAVLALLIGWVVYLACKK